MAKEGKKKLLALLQQIPQDSAETKAIIKGIDRMSNEDALEILEKLEQATTKLPGFLDRLEKQISKTKINTFCEDKIMSAYKLILPIAKPIAIKRLQEQEKQITIYERLKIASVMSFLKVVSFYKYIADKNFRKECIDAKRASKINIDYITDELEAETFVKILAGQWFTILYLMAKESGKLDTALLDDCMLPKNRQLLEYGKLSAFLNLQIFTMEDVEYILRTVKESLPNGQILPECVIRYLEQAGVVII